MEWPATFEALSKVDTQVPESVKKAEKAVQDLIEAGRKIRDKATREQMVKRIAKGIVEEEIDKDAHKDFDDAMKGLIDDW